MQYEIPKKEHDNVMSCYWMMMRELEDKADSAFDRHFVEGYYELWNRVTGDDKKPYWKI